MPHIAPTTNSCITQDFNQISYFQYLYLIRERLQRKTSAIGSHRSNLGHRKDDVQLPCFPPSYCQKAKHQGGASSEQAVIFEVLGQKINGLMHLLLLRVRPSILNCQVKRKSVAKCSFNHYIQIKGCEAALFKSHCL